jgi:c-di-GMP-binding flagellar brake protein YcgR
VIANVSKSESASTRRCSKKNISFHSIVAEVQEDEILIGIPMSDKIGILPNDTEIDISFKSGDNLYKFPSWVIGKKLDNIPLYRIHKPDEKKVYRVQRRENFRVNLNLKVLVNDIEYTTVNVSAGGLLFSGPRKMDLHEGQMVNGQILVPNVQTHELEFVSFQGQIKRVFSSDDKKTMNAALQFTEISQEDQTKIVRACFEQQRKMRLIARE